MSEIPTIPDFLLHPDKEKETDNAILQIVKELSERLGRPGHDLREVKWLGACPPDWPTFLLRNKLGLRWELKGKLTPEEWRPLLASSLVFETRFRGRERLLTAYCISSLAISGFLTVLFFLLLLRFAPRGPSTGRGPGGLIVSFFIVVVTLLLAIPAPYFRRLRLRSDQIASEEFGTRQDLLVVLKKIDDMSINPGGRIYRLTTLAPNISRRIRNFA